MYAELNSCVYLHQCQSLWKTGLVSLGSPEQVIVVGTELLLCMDYYPDLQKAWNRTTNTPLVMIKSKMMSFKELGLRVTIFSGKKSETEHQSTE